MEYGVDGDSGIPGNVDSASYEFFWSLKCTNPPLSAILSRACKPHNLKKIPSPAMRMAGPALSLLFISVH
jgi:hypothetical protein